MELTGIHHVTAITARARENLRFYTGVLGMRLVKRTVNQDDTSAYHLFYADAVGTPGTDLTFFDWPLRPERRGTHSIVRTHLRVAGEASLDWWAKRLVEHGAAASGIAERDGRAILDFEDPEGQRLALVDDGGAGEEPQAWEESPVPAERQIRGLGPVVLSVPHLTATEAVLTGVLRMRREREYRLGEESVVHVFGMGAGGPHAEVHVAVEPHLEAARLGAGGVHHVAYRAPDEAAHDAWVERLGERGIPNTGRVDRFYFRSVYFREPNGILFELATDGPGFAVDEEPDRLGEGLALPPFLEPRRAEIEAGLEPLD